MSEHLDRNVSLWIATTPATTYPRLTGSLAVDVAVVGGGIVGVVTATLLKQCGVRVALVESDRVLCGVTGNTTAKLTTQHGIVYDELVSRFGRERAQLYADANQAAIERVERFVRDLHVECDLEQRTACVYGQNPSDTERLQREAETAVSLGLPARFVESFADVPFANTGALVFDDQHQFHPRKLLLALAATVPGDGSHVFEQSRVVDLDAGSPCTVTTSDGATIAAKHVVLATHMPFLLRGLHFAKAEPWRSYAIAATIDESKASQSMLLSAGSPTRSVRTALDGTGERLLIVSGDGSKTGSQQHTTRRYETLEAWGREHFGIGEVRHRWSTQDFFPTDNVPLVGPISHFSERVLIATGLKGWGMSNGVAAAMMLAGLCIGERSAWLDLFDAERARPILQPKFVQLNAGVAQHFVGDRLAARRADVHDLVPGAGRVATVDGEQLAVYRDDDGAVHALSPRCTHVGCFVQFNQAERSWDCPCHGSRFDVDGRVLNGPATRPLAQRRVSPEPDRAPERQPNGATAERAAHG